MYQVLQKKKEKEKSTTINNWELASIYKRLMGVYKVLRKNTKKRYENLPLLHSRKVYCRFRLSVPLFAVSLNMAKRLTTKNQKPLQTKAIGSYLFTLWAVKTIVVVCAFC